MNDLNITKRGLLCRVSMPSIQSRRKHKDETAKVAADNNADSAMVSVTIALVPSEFADKISAASQRVRNAHRILSLPWDDMGGRIIPIAMMEKHSAEMQSKIAEYHAEVENYVSNIDAMKAAAKIRLGPLFAEDAYDTADAARAKLQARVSYYPLPDAHDFRVDLDNDQIDYLRQSLDTEMRERFDASVQDIKNRMITVTEQFIDRVSSYHETTVTDKHGKSKTRVDRSFRDSVVSNIEALLDIVPGLNITNNMEVVTLARQTKTALCTYQAATLRASPSIRSEVIAKARALLQSLRR